MSDSVNPTLYHLTADLLELDAALRMAEETGDPTEDILAQYLTTGEAFEAKLEGYGHLIRQREAEAAVAKAARVALEDEQQRLRKREETATNTAARLKAALLGALDVLGLRTVRSATFAFTRSQNGGVAPLAIDQIPLDHIPEEYTRRVLATDLIREALERGESVCIIDPDTGEAVPFARLGERGEHLRIK